MHIEAELLDILACPIDKQGLLYFEDEAILYNPRLRRIYRMTDGCLVMLANRSDPASQDEHERLMRRASRGEATGTAGLQPGRVAEQAATAEGAAEEGAAEEGAV